MVDCRGDRPTDATKVYSVIFFVIGFWLLDLCNNTGTHRCDQLAKPCASVCILEPHICLLIVLGNWRGTSIAMGPARALVVDMVAPEQLYLGNAFFSVWMALGNVVGYSIGGMTLY